jgi:uncharacterized protein YqhQ
VAGKAGGQAVFEGVMMRGDDRWAVAVRTPAGGIEVMTAPLPIFAVRWKKVPLLRGLLALGEAMPLGARAFKWSAVHGLGQPERVRTPTQRVAKIATVVAVLGMAMTLPVYATARLVGGLHNGLLSAVLENVLSVGVLLGYAAATGRLSAVRTLFENHGAEHKVVAAHEAGVELTAVNALPFSTRHVRCGTSLLLVIGVVAAAMSVLHLPALVALPLIAAVSAELQLRASANTHRRWVRTLVRPGLALQRVTTREPSLAQLEVAIVALRAAYGVVDMTSEIQPSSSVRVAVPA